MRQHIYGEDEDEEIDGVAFRDDKTPTPKNSNQADTFSSPNKSSRKGISGMGLPLQMKKDKSGQPKHRETPQLSQIDEEEEKRMASNFHKVK